jgi:hypothetical protein
VREGEQGRTARAADLYTAALFRGRRRYVEATCDRWFILSALHGLLAPDDLVEPYDVTLNAMGVAARRAWSASTLHQIDTRLGPLGGCTVEIHAGARYRDDGLVAGLLQRGTVVVTPAEGLTQGQQLAFYKTGLQATGAR